MVGEVALAIATFIIRGLEAQSEGNYYVKKGQTFLELATKTLISYQTLYDEICNEVHTVFQTNFDEVEKRAQNSLNRFGNELKKIPWESLNIPGGLPPKINKIPRPPHNFSEPHVPKFWDIFLRDISFTTPSKFFLYQTSTQITFADLSASLLSGGMLYAWRSIRYSYKAETFYNDAVDYSIDCYNRGDDIITSAVQEREAIKGNILALRDEYDRYAERANEIVLQDSVWQSRNGKQESELQCFWYVYNTIRDYLMAGI